MPSQAYLSAINSRVAKEQIIGMFHIDHPALDPADWPHGIRLCDYGENMTVGDIDYIAMGFRWRRPDKRSDRPATISVEMDNVDPVITNELIRLTEPGVITIWTVMENSPDVIEEGPMEFELQRTIDDRATIRAQLGLEPMLWMRFGRYKFSPRWWPGVFR